MSADVVPKPTYTNVRRCITQTNLPIPMSADVVPTPVYTYLCRCITQTNLPMSADVVPPSTYTYVRRCCTPIYLYLCPPMDYPNQPTYTNIGRKCSSGYDKNKVKKRGRDGGNVLKGDLPFLHQSLIALLMSLIEWCINRPTNQPTMASSLIPCQMIINFSRQEKFIWVQF